ncbi:MAG: ABC transporter ATP-binding protein, partial [Alphaproteobacteria bacterium]|nr:ABC transporter ATP-binding protein [Alphaproteobacteria bacterium]
MSKEIAIKFSNVNQIYPLFTTPGEIFTEFLGLNRLFGKESKVNTFQALKDINLTINKGKRIGIIGQNGAGKTTLLKLATGNYFPTSGKVEIYGKVQSLMDSGLGFHQEFTGRENIKSSLIYNGLTPKQMKESIEDIIEFAELGEFIDQPIKTYSLGMLSRLGFATATAIYPEILIIDEIMGAGDAYFAAKSAERMKKLTHDGTTLLLVSHSTSQIIQFCTEVIWMKDGNIHMQGEALEVCKAYTKYMRERDEARLEKENSGLKSKAFLKRNQVDKTLLPSSNNEKEDNETGNPTVTEKASQDIEITPIEHETDTPNQQGRSILRWNGSGEIRIEDFYMVNSEEEKCFTFYSKESISFIMIV